MNWVGGVRNRLKSSHHDKRKIQKMNLVRQQQGRMGSVSASRHQGEVTSLDRRKKSRVSQDVLAFKMQSEINSKNDVNSGCNFRVVNLGRARPLSSVKNGVNVTRGRRVESVHLPLSPVETPSALDLSYSPNGSVLDSCIYEPGVVTNRTTNMPYAGSRESNSSSAVIDLFGMPVEKPVKTQKAVTSDESKHKYCVNSDRVCRKTSCSMHAGGVMPVMAGIHLPRDHRINRGNTLSSDEFQAFQFTKPDIFSQSSGVHFKYVPTVVGSDNDTCFSEPLLNYPSSRSACDKWCNMSDTDCSVRRDERYIPSVATRPSATSVSDAGFKVHGNFSSFEVSLVNSPQRGELDRKTACTSTNLDNIEHTSCSYTTNEPISINDSDHSIRKGILENAIYSDSLIPNDTEFYAEVPDKIEDIALISSPHSPPKPVFLPYERNDYSPQHNGNIFHNPRMYARKDHLVTRDQYVDQYCCKENHEPLHVLNQERRETELYAIPLNTNDDAQVYSGNKRNTAIYTSSEQYFNYNNDHSAFSNEYFSERQPLHRKESYIVSSGLDCATDIVLPSHSRDKGCSHASSLGWRQVLREDVHEVGQARSKTSTASSGNSNEGKTFRSRKPADLNIADKQSVTYSTLATSCSNHGQPPLTEDSYHRVHTRTITNMNENNTNGLSHVELLSVPLMTSTPRCEQNAREDSNQNNSPESVKQTCCRAVKQTVSASTVLLEMSMLEKQQARPGDVNVSPSLASCTRDSDLGSVFHASLAVTSYLSPTQGINTCSQETTDNHVTKLTPLFMHETIDATPVLLPASNNKSSTDNLQTSQHSTKSLLNTPVTSSDTQEKSEESATLLTERQVGNTHQKEMYPISCVQNKDKNSGERPLGFHCNEGRNRKVSASNLDTCLHSQTGIDLGSPTTKIHYSRQERVSTSSQTTPKLLQDVACSPIKELTQEKQQVALQAVNSTDIHNFNVYCLRSRNKMGQPDSVKDGD